MAVSILGVCCTLFGNFDAPVPFVVKYMIGSIYGVLISLVYSFIISMEANGYKRWRASGAVSHLGLTLSSLSIRLLTPTLCGG
ncbi:FUSC family protein [Agrobacterium sp. 22-222-1]